MSDGNSVMQHAKLQFYKQAQFVDVTWQWIRVMIECWALSLSCGYLSCLLFIQLTWSLLVHAWVLLLFLLVGRGVANVFYYLTIVAEFFCLSCWVVLTSATFITCLFLVIRWLNRLLSTGAKRPLQAEDLYGLLERDQTDTVTEQLERF